MCSNFVTTHFFYLYCLEYMSGFLSFIFFVHLDYFRIEIWHHLVYNYTNLNKVIGGDRMDFQTYLEETPLEHLDLNVKYQSIHHRSSNLPMAYEALARLYICGEEILPHLFIPYLEDKNAFNEVGHIIFEKIVSDMLKYPELKMVFMNLSHKQLEDQDIIQSMLSLLKANNLCERFGFEVRETPLDSKSELPLKNLNSIKAANCLIAIDDFGTGYSSLERLSIVPHDIIKVDKSLIQDMNNYKRIILKHIVEIAHENLKTVLCEGVETKNQLDVSLNLGFDLNQGFLFSHPSKIGGQNVKFNYYP